MAIVYCSCMNSKTINLSLPEELLKKVDELARKNYASRSDYVRQKLVDAIEADDRLQDSRDPWASLLESADELSASVAEAGYRTEADFTRLAKEIRQERSQPS